MKISDYVEVEIDKDGDVKITDNFIEITVSVFPKEEAIAIAKYILEFFK